MKMPLSMRTRKEQHRKIAYAQDAVVEEIYGLFGRAVLHGGTAIWRCYNGKRFSEDLDFYLPKEPETINKLFEILEKKGFKILKRKISGNSYSHGIPDNICYVKYKQTIQSQFFVLSLPSYVIGNPLMYAFASCCVVSLIVLPISK
jgi:predicted nucleotidyltransferase component of viral defense system